MATWAWIVIAVVVVIVAIAVTAAMTTRQRRTAGLRERFGSEYDRTVESRADQRAAEAELNARAKRRDQLDIKPLSEASRTRYAEEWRVIQERFVDEPGEAAHSADALVHTVMAERGYPLGNFSAQSDLVSVDYPEIAQDYRAAHAIYERASAGQASTEDLREALLRYRSLFSELLGGENGEQGTEHTGAPMVSSTASTTPATPAPGPSAQSVPARPGAGQDPANREAGNDPR